MKNIILIGFMGCGKTTVGIRLSYRIRKVLEDTDKRIEREQGRTISEIFEAEGEPYFRDLETKLLQKLIQEKYQRVISTGGGLPVREENRKLLRELGTVIYLRIKPETVYQRLKNDKTRPLLQCEDPLAKIRELMEQRMPLYEEAAHIVIDVDDKDMETVLTSITDSLEHIGESK